MNGEAENPGRTSRVREQGERVLGFTSKRTGLFLDRITSITSTAARAAAEACCCGRAECSLVHSPEWKKSNDGRDGSDIFLCHTATVNVLPSVCLLDSTTDAASLFIRYAYICENARMLMDGVRRMEGEGASQNAS